ncbi:MAG TPA: hypothetical protein PKJ47_10585 [Candidatus Limiplasma sp.]|nr:hypothetical protein [Candidatus Limiplasma sp.]
MPPKKTPKIFESVLLPINQKWLDEYRNDRKIAAPTFRRIEIALQFKDIASKPFNMITNDDLRAYVDARKGFGYESNTTASVISHLSTFAEYLKGKYPEVFEKTFFIDVNQVTPQRETQRPAQALNYIQISAIKRYVKSEPKLLYFFELILQTSVNKDEIRYCIPRNSNSNSMEFSHKGRMICKYNDVIQDIINRYENDTDLYINTYDIATFLRRITEYLQELGVFSRSRDITFQDIRETQKKFFFTCPNCGRKLENHMSNWILAKTEYDDDLDYHLFCKYCKGGVNVED